METQYILKVASLGFGISVLWISYFWFYQQYRVDKTRQELFFLRNALFDYALAGNISFDHPAYGILRNLMNKTIRFTHKIELINLLSLFIVLKYSPLPTNFEDDFHNALSTLDPKVKEELLGFHKRMSFLIATHLITSSILLMFAAMFLAMCIIIRKGWKNLKVEVKKKIPGIKPIEDMAIKFG